MISKTIASVYPNIIQYFGDVKYADYSVNSKKMATVICPLCQKQHSVSIRTIAIRGNTFCPKCCDNYSYPERLMASILDELGIKFKPQYTSSWTRQYRYDFYFIYSEKQYIVEMDGGIGHGHKKGKLTPKESLLVDKEKDNLAISNGCTVIRIDCDYGNENRFDVIRNNIIKSEMSLIFDFSKIDWEKCNQDALSSRVMKIIDLYNNKTPFVDEIVDILHVSASTVRTVLIQARQDNVIDNGIIMAKNPLKDCPVPTFMNKEYQKSPTCPVYCLEDAIAFASTFDADDYYGFPKFTVRNAINSYKGSHKGKHFVKYKDLPNDFEFVPVFLDDSEYRYHAYCQWSLDGHLIKIYENKKSLTLNYNYLAIQRVINGTFQTAYGYKWTILPKRLEYEWINIPIAKRSQTLKKYETILKEEGCV